MERDEQGERNEYFGKEMWRYRDKLDMTWKKL